jgi:hypothetical protein
MHNCKATRNSFVELALDDVSPVESAQLLAELKDCRECQEEFATIKSTLRTSGQALQSALPAEGFWPGYHARLRTALVDFEVSGGATERAGRPRSQTLPRSQGVGARFWFEVRRLLTTSVRVPAPVAAALVLLFGTSVFFAVQSRGAATQKSLTPTSIASAAAPTKVVAAPVIKEKVVTRVVYVEIGRRPRKAVNYVNDGRGDVEGVNSGDDDQSPVIDVTTGLARVRPDPRSAAMSLAGFKPTEEVKLTIIKGSDPK